MRFAIRGIACRIARPTATVTAPIPDATARDRLGSEIATGDVVPDQSHTLDTADPSFGGSSVSQLQVSTSPASTCASRPTVTTRSTRSSSFGVDRSRGPPAGVDPLFCYDLGGQGVDPLPGAGSRGVHLNATTGCGTHQPGQPSATSRRCGHRRTARRGGSRREGLGRPAAAGGQLGEQCPHARVDVVADGANPVGDPQRRAQLSAMTSRTAGRRRPGRGGRGPRSVLVPGAARGAFADAAGQVTDAARRARIESPIDSAVEERATPGYRARPPPLGTQQNLADRPVLHSVVGGGDVVEGELGERQRGESRGGDGLGDPPGGGVQLRRGHGVEQ